MNEKWKMFVDVWSEAVRALVLLSPPIVVTVVLSLLLGYLYGRYFNRRPWPTAVLLCMFGLFGTTIGVFMGASRQPIIASTLPPLLTLISGYVVLTRSADLSKRVRLVLPAALMTLLLMLLLGAFYMRGYTNAAGADVSSERSEEPDAMAESEGLPRPARSH